MANLNAVSENRKLPSTLTSYLALRARDIKVMEEWSYFEDPEIRPRFQRLFRHFKSFSRTQWTIRARIG